MKISEIEIEPLCDVLEDAIVDIDHDLPMIQHPMVHTFYIPSANALYNHIYETKTQRRDEAMAAGDWAQYVFIHERPYRIDALDYLFTEIPSEEFWKLFGDVYVDSENIHQHFTTVASWLDSPEIYKYPHVVMNREELKSYVNLPKRVEIFRGFTPGELTPADWSWSLDRKTAEWFANRFNQGGVVKSGWVDKTKIMALFTRRSESEVLVWPEFVGDSA